MRKLISIWVTLAIFLPFFAWAQLNTFQGGTGTTSPSSILYGDSTIRLKSVKVGQGLDFTSGTLTASGAGFAWTVENGYVSTSTLLVMTQGLITHASSTIGGDLNIQGTLQASSTASISGPLTVSDLTSALVSSDSTGKLIEYAGSSCGANTFAESVSAVGVLTCGNVDVASADITGTLPIANGGTNQTSFTNKQLIAYDGTSLVSTTTLYTAAGATSTFEGGLRIHSTGSLAIDDLASCDTIDTDASGFLRCGSDATGAGSIGEAWKIYDTVDANYLIPTTTVSILVGTSTTDVALRTPNALVNIFATSTGGTLLFASTTDSQTGDILRFASSTNGHLFSVSADGELYASSTSAFSDRITVKANSSNNEVLRFEEASGSEYFNLTLTSEGNMAIVNDDAITLVTFQDGTTGAVSIRDGTEANPGLEMNESGLGFSRTISSVLNLSAGGIAQQLWGTASSTLNNNLNVTGHFSASSTASISGLTTLDSGFISNASSTVIGDFMVADGTLLASSTASFTNGITIKADSGAQVLKLEENSGAEFFYAQLNSSGDLLFLNDANATRLDLLDASQTSGTLTSNALITSFAGINTSGSGDADTGIDFETADEMGLHAGGIEFITLVEGTSDYLIFDTGATGIKMGWASSTPFTALAIGADGAITTTEKQVGTSTAITIDWTQGNQQMVGIGNEAVSFTHSNFVPGQHMRIILCQGQPGTGTATWPNTNWSGGAAPTLTATANKCDVLTFLATVATTSTVLQATTTVIFGSSVLNF